MNSSIYTISAEDSVAKKLDHLNPINYIPLNDLMITSDGKFDTTQIDHVLISKYAIFIIETKSNRGGIYGASWQDSLTEYFFKTERKIYNPFFQNYGHVKVLEKIIRPYHKTIPIVSVVVFPNAKITKVCCKGPYIITTLDKLIDKIKLYEKEYLNEVGVEKLKQILLNANITDKVIREKHNSTIQEYVSQKNAEKGGYDIDEKPEIKEKHKKTGRFTGIDKVYDAEGQLATCIKCGRDYFIEDAIKENWPFYERHCRICGWEKAKN
jgi:hypothetical protein